MGREPQGAQDRASRNHRLGAAERRSSRRIDTSCLWRCRSCHEAFPARAPAPALITESDVGGPGRVAGRAITVRLTTVTLAPGGAERAVGMELTRPSRRPGGARSVHCDA
jgi:hypothetical protein